MCNGCVYAAYKEKYPWLDDEINKLAKKWEIWLLEHDEEGFITNSHIPKAATPKWFLLAQYILLEKEIK